MLTREALKIRFGVSSIRLTYICLVALNPSPFFQTVLFFNGSSSPFRAQASSSVPKPCFTDCRTPWTGDQPVARPLPKHRTTETQNKRIHTQNIHALSGIRTHDLSVRASEDRSCFKARGYCDRLFIEFTQQYPHVYSYVYSK
jgi:hypothetical protein